MNRYKGKESSQMVEFIARFNQKFESKNGKGNYRQAENFGEYGNSARYDYGYEAEKGWNNGWGTEPDGRAGYNGEYGREENRGGRGYDKEYYGGEEEREFRNGRNGGYEEEYRNGRDGYDREYCGGRDGEYGYRDEDYDREYYGGYKPDYDRHFDIRCKCKCEPVWDHHDPCRCKCKKNHHDGKHGCGEHERPDCGHGYGEQPDYGYPGGWYEPDYGCYPPYPPYPPCHGYWPK